MTDQIVVEHDDGIYVPVKERVYAVFTDETAKLSSYRVLFWQFQGEKYDDTSIFPVIARDNEIVVVRPSWDGYLGLLFGDEDLEETWCHKAVSYASEVCGTNNLRLLAEQAK